MTAAGEGSNGRSKVQSLKSKVEGLAITDCDLSGRLHVESQFFVAEERNLYRPSKGAAHRFEDLVVWQRARSLTASIYAATAYPAFKSDPAGADQMRRAALSIGSNIAEGFERGTDAQFRQSLYYAKGSSGELRSQLYSALDNGQIPKETFENLYVSAEEISRMLQRLITYLSRPEKRTSNSRP